ncbi:MAG: sugar-binding protein [Verrucomicrobiae bacterium]|nr:sugar-binding protein [Verrucomicrobiae bacterium]
MKKKTIAVLDNLKIFTRFSIFIRGFLTMNKTVVYRGIMHFLTGILISVSCLGEMHECKPEVVQLNLLKNGNFENGLENWSRPNWICDLITPRIVHQNEGDAILKMEGREGQDGYVMQSVRINPQVKRYKFIGWIKTHGLAEGSSAIMEGSTFPLGGRKGITHFTCSVSESRPGWTKCEKEFDVPNGTPIINIALKARGPVKNSKNNKHNFGECLFCNISLEEMPEPTNKVTIQNIVPSGEYGLFLPHQAPQFSLFITNGCKEAKELALSLQLFDFYNKPIYNREEVLQLQQGPAFFKHVIKIPRQEDTGFYSLKVALKEKDRPCAEDQSAFCIVVPPDSNDPFFGLSEIALSTSFAKAAQLMGIGTVGMAFPHKCESEKGVYEWQDTDREMEVYLAHGFRIVGFFFLTPIESRDPLWLRKETAEKRKNGKKPFDSEYFGHWREFVRHAIKRYHKEIKTWSLAAEINWMTQDWEFDYYQKKVEATYPIAKEIDPHCIIGGVGVSGSDWQQDNFRAAKMMWPRINAFLDGMFFDPYVGPCVFGPGYQPIGEERGGLADMLLAAKDIIAPYGKKKLAIDEKGYRIIRTLPVDSPYVKDAARVLSRGLIIAKSIPEVDRWLFFAAAGAPEGSVDYGLWKIRPDGRTLEPRPMAAAYATVAKLFAGAHDAKRVSLHKDIYVYLFEKDKEVVGALWAITEEPVPFQFENPNEAALYDCMGKLVKRLSKGKNEIFLSKDPLFLTSKAARLLMAEKLGGGTFSLPSIKGTIQIVSANNLAVNIANQVERKMEGSVEICLPDEGLSEKREFALEGQQNIPLIFDLGKKDITGFNKKEIVAKIVSEGKSLEIKKYLDIYKIFRSKEEMKIDGDLSKYKRIMPICIEGVDCLTPVDAWSQRLWTDNNDCSFKAWWTYDKDYLYFSATVTDDRFIQEQKGGNIWMNDAFQIAFDTMGDAVKTGQPGYDSNDYEYGIALTAQGPQCYCWKAAEVRKELQGKLMDFPLAIKRINDTTTNYELAIPWSALAPLRPENGRAFGMDFIYMDSDQAKTTANYFMGLSKGFCGGKMPLYYKTFFLMP